jgi:hypothetical protein
MTFDIPHMIATAFAVFGISWLVDHVSLFDGMGKGRKTWLRLVGIFVVFFAMNLVWPYGATA